MQRNYMNYNEVFPILDLIGRVQNRKRGTANFNSGGGDVDGGDGVGAIYLPPNLRVTKMDVIRDDTNPVMSGVIVRLDIEYENGATAVLEIHRGLSPQVDSSVPDYDFINYVMITGITMTTKLGGQQEIMELVINKENGYGTLLGIEVSWNGELYETIDLGDGEPPVEDLDGEKVDFPEDDGTGEYDDPVSDFGDYDPEFEDPNDFFDNGSNVEQDVVVGQVEGDI